MNKETIFQKTQKRIIRMCLGIVLGTLLLFSVLTEGVYRKVVFDLADSQLRTHKNMILTSSHIQYKEGTAASIVLPAPLIKELICYVWQEDQLIKDSPHAYQGTQEYPVFPEKIDENKIYLLQDGSQYYRGMEFQMESCRVQLLVNVNAQMASLTTLRKVLLLTLSLFILITLALAFYLANVALKPLKMAYEKMAHFIQDASHEMRTPLTVIRGKLELMVRHGKEPIEAHYEELGKVMSELRGLEKMNKDLLLLSKEDLPCSLEKSRFYVVPFFEELTALYEEIAEMAGIQFEAQIQAGPIQVVWDREKVRRCLVILLDNAVKYTPPGGSIKLVVVAKENKIVCHVNDTGYGIKEEALPHIFDRFYRSSEMRGRQIEGSGIGLSLLQALAKNMGIQIQVESQVGVGSTFSLEIPMIL